MKYLLMTLFLSLSLSAREINFSEKTRTNTNKQLESFNLKNKIIVFEWFNKGCPFVKKFYESGEMQKLQAKWTKKKDLVWFTVNSSAPGKQGHETIQKSLETRKSWNIKSSDTIIDPEGKMGQLFGAKTTPHIFVLKNNKVLYEGAIDSIVSTESEDIPKAKNYLDLALNDLYKNREIKVKKTKAYGCSVKY